MQSINASHPLASRYRLSRTSCLTSSSTNAQAPGSSNIFSNRGVVRLTRNELEKATADFDEAIRLEPARSWYYNQRAEAYRARGDYGRSEDDLARARALLARS